MSNDLSQTTFVIVDLETTGASPKKGSAITEIGAVKVKTGVVIDQFESFVNPLAAIPEYITELTGITNQMLIDAPIIDDIFPKFLEFVGDHKETYRTVDTVTIARQVLTKEDVPNCKLGTLAEFFGTKVEPNHRALDDAKATTEVLHGLIERLGSLNITTIDSLLEFAKTAAHIQRKNYYGLSST
ncbi:MAG: DNA polymerase III subunit epsilon [Actinobacteria bacterium]|nr:DNA polymerase III subunit epsilon [Actinomycetota bacterium]